MMLFNGTVIVKFKKSVLEPQGKAIQLALLEQGHSEFSKIRVGKFIELEFESNSRTEAEIKLKQIADDMLYNDVMEVCEMHLTEI